MDYNNDFREPKKSWWQRNWKWFVPTGCLSLLLILALLIGGLVYGVSSLLTNSTPYNEAYSTAISNEHVIEVLGEPIETNGMTTGNLSFKNDTGEADLFIPIKGPKNEATIHIAGRKRSGSWSYDIFEVTIKNSSETIDLLE